MNTRKDNNGKALKKWQAMMPGHIAKPLRHIGNRTNRRELDAKGNLQLIKSPEYKAAFLAAKFGNGLFVSKLARQLIDSE